MIELLDFAVLYRAVMQAAPFGIALSEMDGTLRHVNPALCRLTGWTAADLVGHPVTAIVEEGTHAPLQAAISTLLADRAPDAVFDATVRRPKGGVAALQVTLALLRDGEGTPIGRIAYIQEHNRGATSIPAPRHEAEEQLRQAFEDAPVGMAIMDSSGRFVQVNDALATMTGYSRDQLSTMTIAELSHADDLLEGYAKGRSLLRGEIPSYETQARLVGFDGRHIWVDCNVSIAKDTGGHFPHLIAHVVDITERRHRAEELEHLATHDPLTGLANRRAFEAELARHTEQCERYGPTGALIVLDIDHFKYVNDSRGHRAGDLLIQRVAAALHGRVRSSDVLARLGGDEFAVLAPRADEAEARTLGEALRQAVRTQNAAAASFLNEHVIPTGAAVADGAEGDHTWTMRITTSVGVALFASLRGQAADDVLAAADLAMYAAKEAGRDRVVVHHPTDRDEQRVQARARWLERIRRAVDDDQLTLYAQPIKNLSTGETDRFELLLRMLGEDGEVVVPDDFLAVAERFGLMPEIDRWVVCRAIQVLQHQHAAGNAVTVEVNVSGQSLADAELLAAIERDLARRPVPPGSLVFEVSETAAVADLAEAQHFAARVSELGCSFALDDFGVGFGSFYYAKHLPFDYLKIDGEFIRNCRNSHVDRVVVDSVVELAHGLGKRTIAEFVQDEESASLLRASGVDFGQGYHLGRPQPLDEALPCVS
jgi:diguanylate cyclase (GGDEF)-like protein/PAS domain S-box-containing protein